ncbi:Ribosomal small subunit pseudouridine synthase A [Candidatus Izimaplasma bacterium HR1]|jgi:16S rRNA pseudouridine516 synthase|uniref:pseudouridine synthase n=1 Tax=Candidatus Izimoplasma sp. HR1 TaxID=1541959 RepID=UPI0004F8DC0D|nr:Ribosomal small subunit pseudouridine synthase A [Candidatus Izimaplasma bacterium HR1]
MRLDKLLVNMKYGSRKEMKAVCKNKQVTVNDEVIKDSSINIDPVNDKITIFGEEVIYKENILLMLHKPQGYVSANKDGLHETVFDLLEEPYTRLKLNIAGRLDIDTEGLLLLTDNGDLLHDLISPNKNIYKTYLVRTDQKFNPDSLLKEFEILDGKNNPYTPSKPFIEKINDFEFYISIKEGKYHQVKRMVEHFRREVIYLKRVAYGDISLGDLEIGKYREI